MTTSRVARKPVTIPSGVEAKITGDILKVKGPRGEEEVKIHRFVKVDQVENQLKIDLKPKSELKVKANEKKLYNSIAGTMQSLISNAVEGVEKYFEKKLKLIGVGYRAQSKGNVLSLSLGFSHPTEYSIPEGITIQTPSQTEIIVQGIDKEQVGQVAKEIRAYRPPEVYKGKGIRYIDEQVVLKETKKK